MILTYIMLVASSAFFLTITFLFKKRPLWLIIIFPLFGFLNIYFKVIHPYFFIGQVALCLGLFYLLWRKAKKKDTERGKQDPPLIKQDLKANFNTYKKLRLSGGEISDIFEGIYVGGAAGSGKTRAVLVPLMKHFRTYNIATLVYAYKGIVPDKPELVEYSLAINGVESCDIFAVSHPKKTIKINPLSSDYFVDEDDIFNYFKEMVVSMSKGRSKADSKSEFFTNGAIGYLTALTMFLQRNEPSFCDLPHLVALGLGASDETLLNIFNSSPRIKVQARVYLDSTGDQMSGMKGTIGNFLRSFASPTMFFAFYDKDGKYTSLKFNRKDNPRNLILVNDLSKENVMLPVINSIMYLAISMISKDSISPSALIIDEASTINNDGFSRKPATLRSFECSTVYCVQDKSLVTETTSKDTYDAIISNLGSRFFGRIGSVDTGKDYVQLFEKVFRRETSHTSGQHSSTTTSKRKEEKYDVSYFFKKNPGEFLFYSHGESKELKLPYKKNIFTREAPDVRQVSKEDLDKNYEEILEWGKTYVFI